MTSTDFDPAAPDFAAHRYALLDALREASPVTHVPALGFWAVTGHEEVRAVLADHDRFRSGGAFSANSHLSTEARAVYDVDRPLFTAIHINVDRPLHTRLREPMAGGFRPARMRVLESEIASEVAELAGALFDAEPVADLVARFARPLPVRTLCRLMGLPLEDGDRLASWNEAYAMFAVPSLPPLLQLSVTTRLAEFEDFVRAKVEGSSPLGPGYVADLLSARARGEHDLSDDELVGALAGIIFAGQETTVNTIANGVARLLADRDVWRGLATGTVDAAAVTEEVLRLDASVVGLYRVAAEPVTLAGAEIAAGDVLWVSYAAANRDPAAHEAPDQLRPHRDAAAGSMTFGLGIHHCLGAALARAQVRAAVTALPAHHPRLRLAGEVPELPNHALRAPLAMPVTTG